MRNCKLPAKSSSEINPSDYHPALFFTHCGIEPTEDLGSLMVIEVKPSLIKNSAEITKSESEISSFDHHAATFLNQFGKDSEPTSCANTFVVVDKMLIPKNPNTITTKAFFQVFIIYSSLLCSKTIRIFLVILVFMATYNAE